MKKEIVIGILVLVITLGVTLYLVWPKGNNIDPVIIDEPTTSDEEPEEEPVEEVPTNRIRLLIQNEEVIVELNDSEPALQFQRMLPLTLTFEDYNHVEKISYLEEELDTTNSPSGYDPEVGDFSYYVPWGNLSIFYQDFRYSNSLVKLGTIVSGIEIINNLTSDFEVTIENMEG